MKVTAKRKEEPKHFIPITVTINIETMDEFKLLTSLFKCNISVPEAIKQAGFLFEGQTVKDMEELMDTIRRGMCDY